jgi:hypothetical protein
MSDAPPRQFNLNTILIIVGIVTGLASGFIWAGSIGERVAALQARDSQVDDLRTRVAILEGRSMEHEQRLTAAGH